MKKVKIRLGVFLAVVLIGSFFFSTVHAQVPYTVWEGAWFKLTIVSKGYERNLVGTSPVWKPLNGRFTAFMRIGTWTDPTATEGDETFSADIYFYDEDVPGWQALPVILNRIHGTSLDIFIRCARITGDLSTGTGETLRFLGRTTGKMNKAGTALQTGTFKSLAGSHVQMDPLDPLGPLYEVSGLTITGNLIFPIPPGTFCKSKANQLLPPCTTP
jgi:hypothetical protein